MRYAQRERTGPRAALEFRAQHCGRGREALRRARIRTRAARRHANCGWINEAFDAAQPWLLAKDSDKRDALQTVCSQALSGFQLLTVLLAPVLPQVASRVAHEMFGLDRDFMWADAWTEPVAIKPYRHLMSRIDPKQIDALLEGRSTAATTPQAVPAAQHTEATLPPRRQARLPIPRPMARSQSTISPRSTCASRKSSTPSMSTAPQGS